MKIGDRFGRWTVTGESFLGKHSHKFIPVRCECGIKKVVQVNSLFVGNTKSCGCLQKKHGLSYEPIFHVWSEALYRCTKPSNAAYKNYGGRGIIFCDEWYDPKIFCDWAKANGYQKGLTLDRIDNNKGYSPSNCRFTDRNVQSENRRKMSNNTSGFIGVSSSKGRCQAYARKDNKPIHLGYFDTPEEAARVRDAFVKKHYTSPTLNFA